MQYDIFISDFDGTLVRSDGTISDRTKEAVRRYREAGGIFAICTGRGLPSIMPRVREIGITDGLVVAYQGAEIADIRTGNLLKHDFFPLADALDVIRYFEGKGVHTQIYTTDAYYVAERNELLDIYERVSGQKGTLVNEPLSRKCERERTEVVKILVIVQPCEQEAVFAEAKRVFTNYYVTCSSEWLIEVLPLGQNKGEAVRFLSAYYHVPLQKIAAAGDQNNDLPMIEAAGGKFSVANAVEEVKKKTKGLPSNDEDGIAAALESVCAH